MIDGLISTVIVLPLQFMSGMYDNFPQIKQPSMGQTALWGAGGFVLWLVIHGYFLNKSAQTVGKRLLGIQIVNFDDGRPTPFGRIVLLRYLPVQGMALIPVVGSFAALLDVLLIFRTDQRCAHDHIAGTRVIKLPEAR